jgi:hypothetical protein
MPLSIAMLLAAILLLMAVELAVATLHTRRDPRPLGRRAAVEHDTPQLEDGSPRLAAQALPLRAIGADGESATMPEQSRTPDAAERETREGEVCLFGPDDGHSIDKYHHRRTQHPNRLNDARHMSSDGGRHQL